ncbi:MAG: methionyl-tRNA formyltransferase, partial [Sphingomonadaceae bacterium]
MRIAFMGTPDFAVPALEALVSAGHEIAAVYCQPPRPAGRGKAPRPSPIQLRAESFGLPVRSPVSLRDPDEQAAFAALDLEAAVVAAYGLILPVPVLEAPRHGCFNIHASLLPRWRGAAPVVRAILAGDEKTGVTIMQMEKGLDTGPMLATADTAVDRKTGGALTEELAEAGAGLMVRVLADLSAFPARAQPVEGVSYAAKIDKSEARIDFSAPAEQVERQIRGFNPVPGAFFELKGERIRVLAAEIVARDGEPGEVVDDALTIACESGAIR